MLLSDTIVDFHLFYDGAVDIQIRVLLTRSQCKVSDTQVTVKAHGPLVFVCLRLKAYAESKGFIRSTLYMITISDYLINYNFASSPK